MAEETLSATQWAHVATTLALWLVLPLALGLVADHAERGAVTRR